MAGNSEGLKMTYTMTTQEQIRAAFWQGFQPWQRAEYRKGKNATDIRCEFVDFIDMLARDGQISEALAQRVTL
jgi:hypothetical protein